MSATGVQLKKLKFFAGVGSELLDQLTARAVQRSYHSKMLIFLEGEPADWVYFLLEGNVKLYKSSGNGQEKTVLLLNEEDIFGESGLFEPANYAVTAQTIEDCRILLVPTELLKGLVVRNSILAWRLAEITNLRLRRAYRQVRNQALMDTYSRLISRLYKLTRDYGKKTTDGYRLELSLTHQELANFIGASRETVSRMMKDLEREGLLKIRDHQLLIPDLDQLQEELDTV